MRMDSSKLALIVLTFLIVDVQSIMWYLEPNAVKCLKEEVQADVLVTGEYEVSEAPGQRVDYAVSIRLCSLFFYSKYREGSHRLWPLTFNMARNVLKILFRF